MASNLEAMACGLDNFFLKHILTDRPWKDGNLSLRARARVVDRLWRRSGDVVQKEEHEKVLRKASCFNSMFILLISCF